MVLSLHVLQLVETLLELLSGRRVLSTSSNKLDSVKFSLVIQIVKQFNDLVQLVEVVDLDPAFLKLC